MPAARFAKRRRSAGRIAARAIALVAIGAIGLMAEPTAAASYAVAVAFGGLLLVGVVVAKRNSNEACRCRVDFRRVRVHPLRLR